MAPAYTSQLCLVYRLRVPDTNFVVELKEGNPKDGTPVQIWTSMDGNDNQAWRFERGMSNLPCPLGPQLMIDLQPDDFNIATTPSENLALPFPLHMGTYSQSPGRTCGNLGKDIGVRICVH